MDGHILGSDSEQPRASVTRMNRRPVLQLLAPARSRREHRRPAQMGSDLTRLEVIPNTLPVGLVGFSESESPLGTGGVASVAVAPLLRRDADVMHFPAGSGWQALAVDEPLAHRRGTFPTSTSESEKTFGSGYTHDSLRD